MDIDDLPSPILLIDLDALEHNLNTAAQRYAGRTCKIRPHAKNHRCAHLAHMQLRAGGTVGGVCVSTVGEAEAMVYAGIPSVLVTSPVASPSKVARLCSLAAHAAVMVACDDAANAALLAAIARSSGVAMRVLVEVDTGLRRTGVGSSTEALNLAHAIERLPGLEFGGLMSHEVVRGEPEDALRKAAAQSAFDICLEARRVIEQSGMEVPVVSSGETWSWDLAADTQGITEVQLGSYLLMDSAYAYIRDFRQAVSVSSQIASLPRPGYAIADVGARAIGLGRGLPMVLEPDGVEVITVDRDRMLLGFGDGLSLRVGDRVRLAPANQDAMVNRWNQYVAFRGRRVEAVWPISARGASQ